MTKRSSLAEFAFWEQFHKKMMNIMETNEIAGD